MDNVLIVYEDNKQLADCLLKLHEKYAVKDLGEPAFLLGMTLNRRKDRELVIHQPLQVEEILLCFDMYDCYRTSLPIAFAGTRFVKPSEPATDV